MAYMSVAIGDRAVNLCRIAATRYHLFKQVALTGHLVIPIDFSTDRKPLRGMVPL